MIELREIRATYPGASTDVLDGVSATIGAGRLCALLGPNGSGKSTLIRTIAGLLTPRAGAALLDGRTVTDLPRDERARTVALVPQRPEIAFGFSVREVIEMGRAPHQGALMRSGKRDDEAVERALASCALTDLADRPIAHLSGGEQQRVHVARALAQEPRVLLLDEAAAHLDVGHQEDLYVLVRAQIEERGLTCVAAMHDFNTALRHADEAIVLEQGRVAGAGPASEVLEPDLLSRVFGVALEGAELSDGTTMLAVTARICT